MLTAAFKLLNWLAEVTYLLTRFKKIKFFPWNTKNADRNGINKQTAHTYNKHSEKDNIRSFENKWYLSFLKHPILPTLPLLWKKSEFPLFWVNFKELTPPFTKKGC